MSTITLPDRFKLNAGLLRLVQELGVPVEKFLVQAGIPASFQTLTDLSLSVDDYFRFWETLDNVMNRPDAPFVIGKIVNIGMFDAPILAALASQNLITCFERLALFKPLIGPMKLSVSKVPEGTWIEQEFFTGDKPVPNLLLAGELVFQVSIVRMATGREVIPLRVESSADFANEASRSFFGIKPVRAQRNRVLFSAEDSALPFLTGNDTLWQFYEKDLRIQLGRLAEENSFLARLQSSIIDLLPGGKCTLPDVAAHLCLSVRTLQRNLTRQGTSFKEQLSNARELMAKHYLEKSNLSGTEIAYLLSYDDPNSFPRAFHVWTGKSPDAYRRTIRSTALPS